MIWFSLMATLFFSFKALGTVLEVVDGNMRIFVVTSPSTESSKAYADIVVHRSPNIVRFGAIIKIEQMSVFKGLYDRTVLCKSYPPGLEIADSHEGIENWIIDEKKELI
ncbi:TPA: hypothetical protein O6E21_000204 [Vibrio cholerae]|nr:hypothetical protein [Vibrio cholerae]